jgi:hypothetical protein
MHTPTRSREPFSLVAGGPTHWLQQRLGLIKAETPGVARRAVLTLFLTWVPLLVLSAAQGLAVGHAVRIPFLRDFAAYTRLLIAIPLLILVEPLIARRVAEALDHFLHPGLIPERRRADFESVLHQARNLRDSKLAEAIALVFAALTILAASKVFPFDFSTWHSTVTAGGLVRTWAGWWSLIVGKGLFFFLVWRWLWRLFIWYLLLWRVSQLDLQLIPTHPDGAAGLGFVGETQSFFGGVIFAFSATTAGALANEVVYGGVALKSYYIPFAGYVVTVLLIFLAPLLMLMPRLIEARVLSLHAYSGLAVSHNQMFDRKWVQGDNPKGEPVLGTPEISSLADLGGAYQMLHRMKVIPFDFSDALPLILAAVIPFVPLLLTIMPLGRILELISKALV